jgi:hypothetical protein
VKANNLDSRIGTLEAAANDRHGAASAGAMPPLIPMLPDESKEQALARWVADRPDRQAELDRAAAIEGGIGAIFLRPVFPPRYGDHRA